MKEETKCEKMEDYKSKRWAWWGKLGGGDDMAWAIGQMKTIYFRNFIF